MTVLLVLLTFAIFLSIDYLRTRHQTVSQTTAKTLRCFTGLMGGYPPPPP